MFRDNDRIVLEEIYAKVYALQKDVESLRLEITKTTEKKEHDDKSPFMNKDGLYSFKEYKKKHDARKYGDMKEVIE